MSNSSLFLRPARTPSYLSATRFALLTMTALIVPVAAHAQFFWPDHRFDDDEIVAPAPPARPYQPPVSRQRAAKSKTVIKEAAKPQGPLLIAISIDSQELKIYDNNGLFAQTPISTGMRGHSTPMGVFSVLAKEKYHRSNIYSNAPMPYMQRITWSGVAMHAGVLPGYPASHGCIRMPTNFAIRMYGWTRNGARVVIAPGDLMPTDISHPLLFTRRPDPPKTAALIPLGDAAKTGPITPPKSDREIVSQTQERTSSPANSDESKISAPHTVESLRTADASGSAPSLPVTDAGAMTSKDQTRPDNPALPAEAKAKRDDVKSTDAMLAEIQPADSAASQADEPSKTPVDPIKDAVAVPKRWGHISAFISRKEGKLFVRQNFEPLFEVPVTFADGGPLGTHVFTMRAAKDDPKTFQWSVVSMPQRTRAELVSSRKNPTGTVLLPAGSATNALDRINIPDEARQKLAEIFAPGDSLTVSDLGLGAETGRGTDFIVPLR